MSAILSIIPTDANAWDKAKVIDLLPLLLDEACNKWCVVRPRLKIMPMRNRGYYYNNCISVSSNCKPPVRVPGFSWRYPGYKVDTTFIGVLFHELGHHLYYSKSKLWRGWQRLKVNPISSYAGRRKSEQVAEAMKLFATNPDFLKCAWDEQYQFITEKVGLEPLHNLRFDEVLSLAHPSFVKAAENFINKYKVLGS